MEAELRGALDRARAILTANGARLVILATPCFSPTTRELGEFGEAAGADPARVQWLNDVWRRYAADRPDVSILDLEAHTCPGGNYAATIDGVTMRTDGVHFTSSEELACSGSGWGLRCSGSHAAPPTAP